MSVTFMRILAEPAAALLLAAPCVSARAASPAVLKRQSAIGCAVAEPVGGRIGSLDELRALRQEAAKQQRRVIFNNDGSEPLVMMKSASPKELLDLRTTALAGSHVDSIFYSTCNSGFSMLTYNTKVGQVLTSKEGIYAKNQMPELLAAGIDPLRVMVDFGHQHGIEVFWSMRMNDTHDSSEKYYGPVKFRMNRLKNEHPEWLIGSVAQKPKFGGWSAVDYTRPEIRDLAFRFVEEVCQSYDVDGVELDFFRHPVFFKRAAVTGTECSDGERDLMSDLMQRIRAMTESEGIRRGRPCLVAVRVPDSVDYCSAIGIDLERWLAAGWVDLLVTGGYFQLNDFHYSAGLGRKYGVKVYPSLDESRVKDVAAKNLRSSVASYRGRALNVWQAGADGVYMFNYFNPHSPLWRELGSPAALAYLDHDYFASVRGAGAVAGGGFSTKEFIRIPTLNPGNPVDLMPGAHAEVTFDAGDEPALNGRGKSAVAALRLQFASPVPSDGVVVRLNAGELKSPTTKDNWIEFPITPDQLVPGPNEVRAALGPAFRAMRWTDLHCTIRFPKARSQRPGRKQGAEAMEGPRREAEN